MLDACQTDPDDEAVMLMRVAKHVRKEIFGKIYRFSGSLCDEQYDYLPTYLSALVGMILQAQIQDKTLMSMLKSIQLPRP